MRMRAAVLWQPGAPVDVAEVELDEPRAGEVLVRIAASGVCASDLHVVDGDLPEPMPLVLGHEAAGIVEAAADDVARVRAGDHVVLSILPSCGDCRQCGRGRPQLCEVTGRWASAGTLADGTTRLAVDGSRVHHFNAVSSFAEYAVVPETCVVPIRADVPLDAACLIGCAALTGYGAVTRTAGVSAEDRVAVWGCGGVGLAIVQAARIVGAETIVAVDVRPEKLELALELGATAAVSAVDEDPVEAVMRQTEDGADFTFEALGTEATVRQAWSATAAGGETVVVGLLPKGSALTIDPWGFISEKSLRGCFLGSAKPAEDVPRLVDLYRGGELKLDELVSRRIGLADLNDAFARLRAGEVTRQVVVLDAAR